MLMYGNHHYQYEMGYLPEEHWSRNLSERKCNLSLPYYAELVIDWEFRDSFQVIVDDILSVVASDPSNC